MNEQETGGIPEGDAPSEPRPPLQVGPYYYRAQYEELAYEFAAPTLRELRLMIDAHALAQYAQQDTQGIAEYIDKTTQNRKVAAEMATASMSREEIEKAFYALPVPPLCAGTVSTVLSTASVMDALTKVCQEGEQQNAPTLRWKPKPPRVDATPGAVEAIGVVHWAQEGYVGPTCGAAGDNGSSSIYFADVTCEACQTKAKANAPMLLGHPIIMTPLKDDPPKPWTPGREFI